MHIIGNLLWWLFGGHEAAIGYFTGSLALACTIIGISFAIQTFKIGLLCLWPFGSTVRESNSPTGCIRIPLNLLWLIFGDCGLASCICSSAFSYVSPSSAFLGVNSISRWPGFRSHHSARMWSWDFKEIRKRSRRV